MCVLPVPVCVVTCQRQGIMFRGKCQLGAIPPRLAWFLSWKRHENISCTHTHTQKVRVHFVFTCAQSNTPLPKQTPTLWCKCTCMNMCCGRWSSYRILKSGQNSTTNGISVVLSWNCVQKTTSALQQYVLDGIKIYRVKCCPIFYIKGLSTSYKLWLIVRFSYSNSLSFWKLFNIF